MFQQVDEEICAALQSALKSPQLSARGKTPTSLLNEITVKTDSLILVRDVVTFSPERENANASHN